MGTRNYKKEGDKRSARGQRLNLETRENARALPTQEQSVEFNQTYPHLLNIADIEHIIDNFSKMHKLNYSLHKNQYQNLFEMAHLQNATPLPSHFLQKAVYIFTESGSGTILYIGQSSISSSMRIFQELGGSKNNLIFAGNFFESCWEKKVNVIPLAIELIRQARFDIHVVELEVNNDVITPQIQLESILLQYYFFKMEQWPPLNSVGNSAIANPTIYF